MRRFRLFNLLAIVVVLLSLTAGAVQAQEKTLYWEDYDVEIFIQPDGTFRVVETQNLVFTRGSFTFGIRTIPMTYLTDITDVAVSETDGTVYRESGSGEPFTFQTYESGGDFNIRYTFPETEDANRVVVLDYTVQGGLLYYPEGDQLVWRAVPANADIPIQNASVTVHLPEGTTLDNWDATGVTPGPVTVSEDQRSVRFEAGGPIRGGNDFAVRVQWPSGIVAGQPAPWQQQVDAEQRELEAQEAFRNTWQPVINVAVLALSLFILVFGPLGVYLLWYRKGRDYPVKLPAEWIPEPPSDLAPGMVGTLVDEHAETKDVIATIIDLARRGVLSIQEIKSKGALGIGEKRDFIYRLEDDSLPMRKYERYLVVKLFGSKKEQKLSDLKTKFYSHVSKVQKDLYEEVVEEGFFSSNPEQVRSAYAALGVVALVGAFVIGCLATAFLSQFSDVAICIPLALAVPAIGLILLARFMPRKTQAGAEEAAKWLAFKRYMEDIDRYTDVSKVKEIFDMYLPYAIVFGLEDEWIRRFAKVDTAPPPWYYPGPYLGPRPRRYMWWGPTVAGGSGGGSPIPVPEGGGVSPPSMGDVSRGMGQSLSGMSAGMSAMLTAAATTLTSRPQPSSGSGSWSRGGGSWSGGGGFSGGGWSGGGGFGGGGGGGSSFG